MHRVSATGPKAEPWPWAGYAPVALRFASETRSRREMLGRRYLVMLGYLVMRWSHSAWIDADYEKPGLWARTWAFVHRLHICGRAGRRWRMCVRVRSRAHIASHRRRSIYIVTSRTRRRTAHHHSCCFVALALARPPQSAAKPLSHIVHTSVNCQLATPHPPPGEVPNKSKSQPMVNTSYI